MLPPRGNGISSLQGDSLLALQWNILPKAVTIHSRTVLVLYSSFPIQVGFNFEVHNTRSAMIPSLRVIIRMRTLQVWTSNARLCVVRPSELRFATIPEVTKSVTSALSIARARTHILKKSGWYFDRCNLIKYYSEFFLSSDFRTRDLGPRFKSGVPQFTRLWTENWLCPVLNGLVLAVKLAPPCQIRST